MQTSFNPVSRNLAFAFNTSAAPIFFRGNRLYGSSLPGTNLQKSTDRGVTWTTLYAGSYSWVAGIETNAGTILALDDNGDLYRSTDGVTFTSVLSLGARTAVYHGFDQSIDTNTICFGEYGGATGNYNVWRSTDDGATWTAVLTKVNPTDLRHWHSVNYITDAPGGHTWIATHGDPIVGWYVSTDDGATWTATTGVNHQEYRTLNVQYLPNGYGAGDYVWATDSDGYIHPAVYKVDASQLGTATPTRLLGLPHLAWCFLKFGSRMLVATRPENTDSDFVTRIFLSEDAGQTWEEIFRWPGYPSTDTVCGFIRAFGPTADGDVFFYADKLSGGTASTYGTLRIALG